MHFSLLRQTPSLALLVQNDARFRRIAEAWEGLSEAAKDRVMAIVENDGDAG